MSSNNHKNKARNQQWGSVNAHWFTNRVARGRKRKKIAKASRKAQWRRK